MPPVYKKMYRVYVKLGRVKYYANGMLDHIRWKTTEEEYPEHYSWNEMRTIRVKYCDQLPRYEEVMLVNE